MAARCAGILIATKEGKALFLKRGGGGDAAGTWCFPGGHAEPGESLIDAAVREAQEESGFEADPKHLREWTRTISKSPLLTVPEPAARAEKSEVGYGPSTGAEKCGDCANYRGGGCRLVVGEIAPDGWCKLFADAVVDFMTFVARVEGEFAPLLGPPEKPEHVGFAWAPIGEPPEPLHPGCRIALARFGMDETQVATAIAAGELASPQRFENMWLFDLRITGTGTAFRSKHDEFVYRPPEEYLNDAFLARCNGLPVVWMHPKKTDVLNSEEFANRVVGTILLPYIKGDEVRGVARVYDDDAATIMNTKPMSTSPAVAWRDQSVNEKIEREDGSVLLIEGKPSLLDHLAICEVGVWDKGGPPRGISAAPLEEQQSMAADDAAKRADDDARRAADAANGEKLDKILAGLDSIGKRMDAVEKRMDDDDARRKDDDAKRKDAERCKSDDDARRSFSRRKDDDDDDSYSKRHDAEEKAAKEKFEKEGDPEPAAADRAKKARKDAEELEKNEHKNDDAKRRKDDDDAKKRADAAAESTAAQLADAHARIAKLEREVPRVRTDDEVNQLSAAQARADEAHVALGGRAPRFLVGETLAEYRLRLANGLKAHSAAWKDSDLAKVAVDDAAFAVAERAIYADATAAGLNPQAGDGALRPITRTNQETGQRITTWHGRGTFIGRMTRPARRVVGFTKSLDKAG